MARMSIAGRLFQARMWREYAQTYAGRVLVRDVVAWNGRKMPATRIDARWVSEILRKSKAECMRLARVNLYLAKRLNRASAS